VSANSNRITAELAKRGHTNIKVWWEPIQAAAEMCGPGGGWLASTDQIKDEPLGLSAARAVHHIRNHPWMQVKESP